MKKSLEELYTPEDLNQDGTKHAASDYFATVRLLDQVYDTAGEKYGYAVRRCINPEFDHRRASLENEAFRRVVYENVVALLEEDVAFAWSSMK